MLRCSQLLTSRFGTYSYGATGQVRPHAVSAITGTVNGVVNPTYSYDSDGNLTSGAGRTLTYTAFNVAASIVQGSTSLCFAYDSEHSRIKETVTSATCAAPDPNAALTTYLNDPTSGVLSEKLVVGSTTTWHDYIKAEGQIVAERVAVAGGSTSFLYFTLDSLGSIAVVADQNGNVTERDSYDAWGRRRNPNGTDNASCSIASATTRGFTNQEELDQVCLVNLNARLYDPTVGRFMSADPVAGDPSIGQELNRYSYVLNNPLSLTDPSGLCFLGCAWKSPIFSAVLDIVLVFVLPEAEEFAFGFDLGATANAAIAGAVGSSPAAPYAGRFIADALAISITTEPTV